MRQSIHLHTVIMYITNHVDTETCKPMTSHFHIVKCMGEKKARSRLRSRSRSRLHCEEKAQRNEALNCFKRQTTHE